MQDVVTAGPARDGRVGCEMADLDPRFSAQALWLRTWQCQKERLDPVIPYHSKYNPIERCWGILEQHWNGALLRDANTMLQWARSMTWKGIHPVVALSQTVYAKGVALTKKAMRAVEARLLRNPELPKWDILIRPACLV